MRGRGHAQFGGAHNICRYGCRIFYPHPCVDALLLFYLPTSLHLPTHPPPNDHPLTFVDSIEPGVIPQAVSAVKALLSQLSEGVETQAEEVLSQLKEVRSRIRVGALDRGGAK